jgi:hypothetical protein
MGWVLYVFVVLFFAAWVTVHVALSWTLWAKNRTRAVAGFFLFPLAPYFAHGCGIHALPVAWVGLFLGYAVSWVASQF